MRIVKITLVVILLAALQGCNAMKGQSDTESMLEFIELHNPDEFEAAMYSFVNSAKSGNVEQMLALTSDAAITETGLEALRDIYTNYSVRTIRYCTSLSKRTDVIAIRTTGTGKGPGWVVRKTCFYGQGKAIPIQFVMLKENGRIGLYTFSLWVKNFDLYV